MPTLNQDQNISKINNRVKDTVVFSKQSDCEEVEMGIATDGMDFVLEMLTDLSVDRGAYALRETWSNAYDATVATGDMSRRIDIVVPTRSDVDAMVANGGIAGAILGEYTQAFTAKVIDRGIGMSYDDIKQFFTQYGGSKKRSEKNQVGSKGLGAKAPLAVSDSFSVISVKDGTKTSAVIERRNHKNVATLSSCATDEPNGTTVEFPITDPHVAEQITRCADTIARYNIDANLYVNGKKTESFLLQGSEYSYLGEVPVATDDDGNVVKFRIWQHESSFMLPTVDRIDLNLAGVRYKLKDKYLCGGSAELVVAGDPGYLNFTPSRDEIKDDDARRKFIEAIDGALAKFDFTEVLNERLKSFDNIVDLVKWADKNSIEFEYEAGQFSATTDAHYMLRSFDLDDDVLVKGGIDYKPLFVDPDAPLTKIALYGMVGKFASDMTHFISKTIKKEICACSCSKADVIRRDRPVAGELTLANLLTYFSTDMFSNMVLVDGFETAGDFKKFLNSERNLRNYYARSNTYFILVPGKFEPTDLERPFYEKAFRLDLQTAIERANEYKKLAAACRKKETKKSVRDLSSFTGRVYHLVSGEDVLGDLIEGKQHCHGFNWNGSEIDKFCFYDKANLNNVGLVCANADDITQLLEAASIAKAAGKLDIDRIVLCKKKITNRDIDILLANGAKMLSDLRTGIKKCYPSVLDSIDGISVDTISVYRRNRIRYMCTVDVSVLGLESEDVRKSISRDKWSHNVSDWKLDATLQLLDLSRLPKHVLADFAYLKECLKSLPSPKCSAKILAREDDKMNKMVEKINRIQSRIDRLWEGMSFVDSIAHKPYLSEKTIRVITPGLTEEFIKILSEETKAQVA